MNKKRRSRVLQAASVMEAALRIIESACDEERDCLYNMPENLEGSFQYGKMEEAVENLEDAVEKTKEVIDLLYDAT